MSANNLSAEEGGGGKVILLERGLDITRYNIRMSVVLDLNSLNGERSSEAC